MKISGSLFLSFGIAGRAWAYFFIIGSFKDASLKSASKRT